MSAVIELAHFSFAFGDTPILADVSLRVEQGEYLSIIGPNGAGKSTLVKCLNRILTGGRGSVRIMGRDLARYTQRELARVIGYVPQADGRTLPFKAHDVVMMGRYPHLSPFSTPAPADEQAVREALAMTGADAFVDRLMTTLSGGERQKVLIAAALAQQGSILLLDEPTTFLDPHHQADIAHLIKRINRELGVTVLSVTHDINGAVLASSRILALKGGKVAYCGHPDGVMTDEVLEGLFGKRFLFVEHPTAHRRLMVPEGLE